MKLHVFHFTLHGIARAIGQLRAGARLCRAVRKSLRPLVPASVNSMTAAWNFRQTIVANGLRPPKTIIDVGANQSQMSRLLMMACEHDARLVSFEPNPHIQPDGEIFRIALSDTDGTAAFTIPGGDANWGRLGAAAEGDKFQVEKARLDTLVSNNRLAWNALARPLLVKIDTEGHEFEVLRGMGNLLASTDMLLIEVENAESRGQNYSMISLCTFLGQAGFARAKILYACYDGPDAPAYCDVLFWR